MLRSLRSNSKSANYCSVNLRGNEIDKSSELYVITNLLNSGADGMPAWSLRNDIVIRLKLRSGESPSVVRLWIRISVLSARNPISARRRSEMGRGILPNDSGPVYWIGSGTLLRRPTRDSSRNLPSSHAWETGDPHHRIAPRVRRPRGFVECPRSYCEQALEEVVQILKNLGCRFPKYGRTVRCIGALGFMTTSGRRRSQNCQDKNVEWIMYLLNQMSTVCYQVDQAILPLVFDKGLKYTMKHGAAEYSAPNLATIGLLLAAVLGNFVGGKK